MSAGSTFDLNSYSQIIGNLTGTGGMVTNYGSGTPVLTVNQAADATFSGLLTAPWA